LNVGQNVLPQVKIQSVVASLYLIDYTTTQPPTQLKFKIV
jgi:hypothetical protein